MHIYNKYLLLKFGMTIGILAVYLHADQLHEGLSHFRISLWNSPYFSLFCSSFGRLFQIQSPSHVMALCPYLDVFALGMTAVLPLCREYWEHL